MGLTGTCWLLFVLFVLIAPWTSMGNPRLEVAGQTCNSSTAVSGDVLADNFVPAMGNLSSLAEEKGFGTTIVGEGSNTVFGLVQCFKDLNSIDCRLCFSEIRSLLPKCYPRTGGKLFLDGCFGRYENYSFFNEATDSHDSRVCSPTNKSSEPMKFRDVVRDVVESVSSKAERKDGFAVGTASVSGLTVYALAQCWEILDTELCNSCLNKAASSLMSCIPSSEGRALNAGCYMRYSTRMFWNLNQAAQHSSGKGKNLGIALGVTLGGLVVIILAIILWNRRCHFKNSNFETPSGIYKTKLAVAISLSNSNFPYNNLKKATKNFDLSNKIGQGSYGTVYKGILSDGREVAIKRLFLNTRQWIDQFLNEVDLINGIRHKNLVKLLGCSVDGPASILVYEYLINRSLDQFIFDPRQAKLLDWEKRFNIIQGVAEGLFYLHEESEIRIIHRDIKASNILLDEKFKPKITDFGLARAFGQDLTHLSTGIAGTLGYMAPEYIVHGHLTEKADVYSFGILVLEVLMGRRCSSGAETQARRTNFLAQIWSHYKANTIEELIDRSFYEERLKNEILQVVHVGLLCTQASPSYRPTMGKVVELLRSEEEGEIFPTEPPFLDVMGQEGQEEGEVSHLLSVTPGVRLSTSSVSQVSGR